MATNYRYNGESIPWTNATGALVTGGSVVVLVGIIGVAVGDIPDGESGELALEEVWELPKKAGDVCEIGTPLYYDAANHYLTTTVTAVAAGVAVRDAAGTDATVWTKVNV